MIATNLKIQLWKSSEHHWKQSALPQEMKTLLISFMECCNFKAKISMKNNPHNRNSFTTQLISAVYCSPPALWIYPLYVSPSHHLPLHSPHTHPAPSLHTLLQPPRQGSEIGHLSLLSGQLPTLASSTAAALCQPLTALPAQRVPKPKEQTGISLQRTSAALPKVARGVSGEVSSSRWVEIRWEKSYFYLISGKAPHLSLSLIILSILTVWYI